MEVFEKQHAWRSHRVDVMDPRLWRWIAKQAGNPGSDRRKLIDDVRRVIAEKRHHPSRLLAKASRGILHEYRVLWSEYRDAHKVGDLTV